MNLKFIQFFPLKERKGGSKFDTSINAQPKPLVCLKWQENTDKSVDIVALLCILIQNV